MATDVLMPQMGESIAEGTIVKWLKQVGDVVQRDEPLFEISTDKVDAEVPSTVAGVLTEILAKEGDTVAVNSIVARVGEAGAAGAPAAPAKAAEPPAAAAPPPPPPAAKAAPAAPKPSAATPPPVPPPPADPDARRARSSPLVRNIAREHDVNLDTLTGTGNGGRITKEDILNFIAERKTAPAAGASPAPSSAPAAPPSSTSTAPAPRPFAPGERVLIEPMSVMRRKIAEHMVLSRRTSAHVTTFFEVDYTNIARLRERLKRTYEERNGVKLTYLPFILKATVDSLKAFPVINASLDGESVVYKQDINIGIAVALDWGLIVPVVKQADELSLVGLARATQDLAGRARNKQLKPDEVTGGTFSITNFGLFGGLTATPIINQPQLAILGIGGITKRPWVVETDDGDAIAIRSIGILSLSFDHRVVDGAVADQFMAHLRKGIEATDFSTLV
jgi:pyruvate dehydrogenase E2 component (dihydrolipoamide acetyltransferase)